MTVETEKPAVPEGVEQYSAGLGVDTETTSSVRSWTNTEPTGDVCLMETVVDRADLQRAYKRVMRNKGAGGVDGLEVTELGEHLKRHWPVVKAKPLEGKYQPQPVRRVSIPKPNGGERDLGIPTVLDRLIQQALHQVLSPLFEPTFSEHSYGFRPGRSAHGAALTAQAHVASGHDWVVDLDLESFFERVNHDVLMARVGRVVTDWRVLKLIRKYLKVGVMVDGLQSPRQAGRLACIRQRETFYHHEAEAESE